MEHRSVGAMASALCLALLVSGCAPFQQYRTQYDLCSNPAPGFSDACKLHAMQQMATPSGANYLLGIIEFDDQGQLWDRQQMKAVISQLQDAAAKQDLLMVVFVHGWNHSAAPGDAILDKFRKVMDQIGDSESQLAARTRLPARQVVGIYLGWRGGSMAAPGLNSVTFWDRKNTAGKVGHGSVPEILDRLEQIKRDKDATMDGESATRLAVVGHSFGAEIVYGALAHVLENRFVLTSGPGGEHANAAGFGNLVVLINPAFESLLYGPLSDMSTERGFYFPSQLPVMAVLTSDADWATRFAFPFGRRLSTAFEAAHDTRRRNATSGKEEVIPEGQTQVTALGHFEPYCTHRLYPQDDRARKEVRGLDAEESVRSAFALGEAWGDDKPGSKIAIAGLTLERTTASAGRNPYLIIKADDRLITEHNDIDDPRIIEFVKQLILVSAQTEQHKEALRKEPVASPAR